MDLESIKGLGARKVEALQAAGIQDARALAELDLRRNLDLDGITPAALKTYKQRARAALAAAGEPFGKAPYRSPSPEKPGFLARLLRR